MPVHGELSSTTEVEGCGYSEGVIYGNGGNGNKDEPKGSAGALCTPYWVPLDVTGDILCEGQKQTTQQKQADVDKRRHTGLIIGELGEFSGKMPPRYLAEPSNPIRPGDVLLWGLELGDMLSFSVKGLEK